MESVGVSGRGVRRKGRRAGLRSESGGATQSSSWSGPAVEEKHNGYDMLYGIGSEKPQIGRGTIVAADLLYIPPIPGVRTLQIDFLSPEAGDLIRAMLMSPSNPEGKADLILSDMAANFTGNRARDTEASLDICLAVLEFVKTNLRTVQETGKSYSGSLLYVSRIVTICHGL
jgi:23S rRNA (uridine2552-2'-O)-methyltransferase